MKFTKGTCLNEDVARIGNNEKIDTLHYFSLTPRTFLQMTFINHPFTAAEGNFNHEQLSLQSINRTTHRLVNGPDFLRTYICTHILPPSRGVEMD